MQTVERINTFNDWTTIIFLGLFIIIFLLKIIDAKKLKEVFFGFFNWSSIEETDLGKPNSISAFQVIILLFSSSVFSLLVNNLTGKFSNADSFVKNFLFISAFVIVKIAIERLLSIVFLIQKEIAYFLKLKLESFYTLSLFIYIFFIFYEYANLNSIYLYYYIIFLLVLRFTYVIIKNKNLIVSKLFYFILYICTLEIAPLLLLYKLMF